MTTTCLKCDTYTTAHVHVVYGYGFACCLNCGAQGVAVGLGRHTCPADHRSHGRFTRTVYNGTGVVTDYDAGTDLYEVRYTLAGQQRQEWFFGRDITFVR